MFKRHEYFLAGLLNLSDSIFDDSAATGKSFSLQNLPDPFGRVTLLLGHVLVLLENLPDPLQVGVNLELLGWLGPAIARWRWILEAFSSVAQCMPVSLRIWRLLTPSLKTRCLIRIHSSMSLYTSFPFC